MDRAEELKASLRERSRTSVFVRNSWISCSASFSRDRSVCSACISNSRCVAARQVMPAINEYTKYKTALWNHSTYLFANIAVVTAASVVFTEA